VYISNVHSMTTHAILSSVGEATTLRMWSLYQDEKIPRTSRAFERARQSHISGKIIYKYQDDTNCPSSSIMSYEHTHIMERAVRTTCSSGFMLRNLEQELCSRLADELALMDKNAKALGNKEISNQAMLNACLGKGNHHFYKYSIFGHVYLLLQVIIEEITLETSNEPNERERNRSFENMLSSPYTFSRFNCFPKEISPARLATPARECIKRQ
jgi:hypothetical protein